VHGYESPLQNNPTASLGGEEQEISPLNMYNINKISSFSKQLFVRNLFPLVFRRTYYFIYALND